MKIGLIRAKYTPYGGAEAFLKRFIAGLKKKGHDVEVFSTSWEESGGLKVNSVKVWGPSFLRPLIFARNAARAVERSEADCVISLERTYCQDVYRAGDGCHREWLKRRGAAVSWLKRILIRLNPLHFTILHLEKKLFSSPRLKKVIANSEQVKRDIIKHYRLPEERLCVIYNGIDPSFGARRGGRESTRLELGVGKDTALVLFVGSGFERKGLLYAVRAMSFLKDSGKVKLLVIGKGRTTRYLKEAKRLGIEDRVIFKGPVKDSERFYKAADIFLLPSIYEPFSNACLEAMASGLPVVTSRVNGASEILTDGVNGAIIEDPADPLEVARKVKPFLDAGKRKDAGINAKIEARKHTMEGNVNAFLALIDSIAATEKGSGRKKGAGPSAKDK